MQDYTPAHRKCGLYSCPSIHKLEDGRWLVVGFDPGKIHPEEDRALNRQLLQFYDNNRVAWNESVTILPSDLLDEIKAEAIREHLAQHDRPGGEE